MNAASWYNGSKRDMTNSTELFTAVIVKIMVCCVWGQQQQQQQQQQQVVKIV